MTCWILTLRWWALGPPKPLASCAEVRFDVSGRGMCWEVGWVHPACMQEPAGSAGHVPHPMGPQGQAAAAEHVPLPMPVAMRSLFAAAAGLGSPCPVSSRCSRITTCMVSLQRFLSPFFCCREAFLFGVQPWRNAGFWAGGWSTQVPASPAAPAAVWPWSMLSSLPTIQNSLLVLPLGCVSYRGAVPGVL